MNGDVNLKTCSLEMSNNLSAVFCCSFIIIILINVFWLHLVTFSNSTFHTSSARVYVKPNRTEVPAKLYFLIYFLCKQCPTHELLHCSHMCSPFSQFCWLNCVLPLRLCTPTGLNRSQNSNITFSACECQPSQWKDPFRAGLRLKLMLFCAA